MAHLIDPAPRPDELLAIQQRWRRLALGLEALRPQTREILLLHRIDGLNQAQIGARLGISVSTVEKHIARAASFFSSWMNQE